jgi:DNA polymerase/3'-5' exonuclease PolX
MCNRAIAEALLEQARRLASTGENLFRVRAHRQAAMAVQGLDQPVEELIRWGGRRALEDVPGIGRHLAEAIAHYLTTGAWRSWSELRKTG